MAGHHATLATRRGQRWRIVSALLGGCLSLVGGICRSAHAETNTPWTRDPVVLNVRLELTPGSLDSLRTQPRRDVPAALQVNGIAVPHAKVHLKGRSGSFQPVDRKPSWTVDVDRTSPAQMPQGLRRFHLNNAGEDPSYLCEWLGAGVFEEAGIPCPAVLHARVWLNGRSLGLYVLKEGWTDEFLRRTGWEGARLYEANEGSDIDGDLVQKTRNASDAESDRNLFSMAAEALRAGIPETQWEALAASIDVDEFLTFQALEILLGHRDGYCMAKNNYRLLVDPGRGRVKFLPHGMDQLFQPPELPWDPHRSGSVARAINATPKGREAHRARCVDLFQRYLALPDWPSRIGRMAEVLKHQIDPAERPPFQAAIEDLERRVAVRIAFLQQELEAAPTVQPEFRNGVASLSGWLSGPNPDGGRLERLSGADGTRFLHVVAAPVTLGSWKTRVRLEPGRYRLEGRARSQDLGPLPFGHSQGIFLRASGGLGRKGLWPGPSGWTDMALEFEVQSPAEDIDLFADVRASRGEVWFDESAFRLIRRD